MDSIEYLTDENIHRWNIYFEKLSQQKKKDSRFIEDHKIQVMDDFQIKAGTSLFVQALEKPTK